MNARKFFIEGATKRKFFIKGIYGIGGSCYGVFTGQWYVKLVIYFGSGSFGDIHSIIISPPLDSFNEAIEYAKAEYAK